MFRRTIGFTFLVIFAAAAEKWLLHMNMHIILLFPINQHQPHGKIYSALKQHGHKTEFSYLLRSRDLLCDCIFLFEGY